MGWCGVIPTWRVCLAPVSRECRGLRVRVRVGKLWRDFDVTTARAVADKIHDLCDHIDESTKDSESS